MMQKECVIQFKDYHVQRGKTKVSRSLLLAIPNFWVLNFATLMFFCYNYCKQNTRFFDTHSKNIHYIIIYLSMHIFRVGRIWFFFKVDVHQFHCTLKQMKILPLLNLQIGKLRKMVLENVLDFDLRILTLYTLTWYWQFFASAFWILPSTVLKKLPMPP